MDYRHAAPRQHLLQANSQASPNVPQAATLYCTCAIEDVL